MDNRDQNKARNCYRQLQILINKNPAIITNTKSMSNLSKIYFNKNYQFAKRSSSNLKLQPIQQTLEQTNMNSISNVKFPIKSDKQFNGNCIPENLYISSRIKEQHPSRNSELLNSGIAFISNDNINRKKSLIQKQHKIAILKRISKNSNYLSRKVNEVYIEALQKTMRDNSNKIKPNGQLHFHIADHRMQKYSIASKKDLNNIFKATSIRKVNDSKSQQHTQNYHASNRKYLNGKIFEVNKLKFVNMPANSEFKKSNIENIMCPLKIKDNQSNEKKSSIQIDHKIFQDIKENDIDRENMEGNILDEKTKIINENLLYSRGNLEHFPQTSIKNYRIIKEIGKGAFAKVSIAEHILTGQIVAIKSIDNEYIKDPNFRKRILLEVFIQKKIRHPNIIKLYEVFEGENYLYIVLEYGVSGDLLQYLKSTGKLQESEAKHLFKQLVYAVAYLQ